MGLLTIVWKFRLQSTKNGLMTGRDPLVNDMQTFKIPPSAAPSILTHMEFPTQIVQIIFSPQMHRTYKECSCVLFFWSMSNEKSCACARIRLLNEQTRCSTADRPLDGTAVLVSMSWCSRAVTSSASGRHASWVWTPACSLHGLGRCWCRYWCPRGDSVLYGQTLVLSKIIVKGWWNGSIAPPSCDLICWQLCGE